jgi:hypothetical protein
VLFKIKLLTIPEIAPSKVLVIPVGSATTISTTFSCRKIFGLVKNIWFGEKYLV